MKIKEYTGCASTTRQEDLPLFEQPLCHTNDTASSYIAADKLIKSGKLSQQEAEVYETLKRHDRDVGYTAKELAFLMSDSDNLTEYMKDYYKIQRRLSGLRRKSKAGRVRIDGTLTFSDSPNKNELRERLGCCVWRAK